MKVVTIGSRIFDDALTGSQEKISNEKRIVGISPFSIYGKIDLPDVPQENVVYEERMFSYQYCHNLALELKNVEFDYLIIDFLSAAEGLLEFKKVSGKNFYALKYPWLEHNLNAICEKYKIKLEKRINPINWSVQKTREEIDRLCDYLLTSVPKEKIVMLKAFIPYQYLEDDVIKTGDVSDIVCKNEFIRSCQDIFANKVTPHIIEIPYNFVRMDKEVNSYNIKFSHRNYEYIIKSLLSDYESDAAEQQQVFLNSIAIKSMNAAVRDNFRNRKLLLLCERFVAAEDDVDWKNAEFIPYKRTMKEADIEESLKQYKGLNHDYFFVLPHIYNESNILRILWKLGFMIRKDIAIYQMMPVTLNDFEGRYIDCFNNIIESKHKTSIRLAGIGCNVFIDNTKFPQRITISDLREGGRIFIGENVKANGLKLKAFWASDVTIGRQSSFADRCYLVATGYSNIIIGEDAMFSTEVVCHGGDGHAIYDHPLGIATNNQYDEYKSRDIIIEDHVWIGYQAMLLKGAHVCVGSILGARTVLARAVPNNCIVAGIPGKVVRKNIYWEREPFTDRIENPVYANATVAMEGPDI